MKETMRKIMLVITVIFFGVFSILAYPMQQAQAGPIAGGLVPGGITIGAGTYTLGALALAGLVGAVGYDEHSDAINAHANKVWTNGTQLSKDALNLSIESAVGAGNAMVNFEDDFINWLGPKIDDLAKMAMNTSGVIPGSMDLQASPNGYTIRTTSAYPFTMAGNSVDGSPWFCLGTECTASPFNATYSTSSGGRLTIGINGKTYTTYASSSQYTSEQLRLMMESMTSFGQAASIFAQLNPDLPAITLAAAEYADIYSSGVTKTREAWESMKDAGLVLPVDSAVPLSNVDGSPLRYNADSDTYTGIDGGVYTGTPDWAFPQPRIRVANPDIPGSVPTTGVYVDTPVFTGNPAYDESITGNPDIPLTTTNVQTGITVGNPDYATSTPIDPPVTVPPVVPPFDSPGTTGLDFTPLMMTGTTMTNKFPFSIPFDFVRQIRVFDVEPVAPSFDIDIPEFIKLGGFVIPFKMKLSFEIFDPIANIIRWGMIIIWDISLIFAIRKLLPE